MLLRQQAPQCIVVTHGILQVTDNSRPDSSPLQVLADRLGQQPGHILVRLSGELFKLIPDLLFHFGTDFDGVHTTTVVSPS